MQALVSSIFTPLYSFFSSLLKKEWLVLGAIVLVATLLRFWKLGILPFGIHTDEIMNGYIGRFILQNGKDVYGNSWPVLYFNNFGDYPNVIPMYFSGLFTFLFGVNTFAIRFPIAMMGVLTVVIVYFIARSLFKERWMAYVPALLVAILPWHIVLSRATAEGVTATAVFLLGFQMVFQSLKKQQLRSFLLGILLLAFTYLLYPGFRVFVPLAFLVVPLLAPTKQWRIKAVLALLVFLGLTAYISQTPWGKGRYDQTSVFTHNNVIKGKALQYATGLGEGRILEARIFHNKVVLSGREILRQYVTYFSPTFLFNEGGKPFRYLVPEHGVIYLTMLAVFILGMLSQLAEPLSGKNLSKLFQEGSARFYWGWAWLFFTAPVSSALTLEDVPNVHRAAPFGVLMVLILVPFLWMLFQHLRTSWQKVLVAGVFLFCLSGELIYFWHFYSNFMDYSTKLYRSEEQRVLSKWLLTNQNTYDQIYMPGFRAPLIHYLFYKQDFRKEIIGNVELGLKIDQIDNIHFVQNDCPAFEPEVASASAQGMLKNTVIVSAGFCSKLSGFESIDTVLYKDLTRAYRIEKYLEN